MGRLPAIKNIKTEDFSEQRGWIGKLLSPLNQFMLQVYQTLNQQVEFETNIRAKIQTFIIQDSSAIDFDQLKVSIGFKPQGVLVLSALNKTDSTSLASAVGVEWAFNGQGQVSLTNIVGLVASKKYEIKVLIL